MGCSPGLNERPESLSQSLPIELLELINRAKITASFVVDKNGLTVNELGNSSGLGNATDLALLRALRANAEVVFTSGLTARADSYRMPKTADLAIFTRAGVDNLELDPAEGKKLSLIGPDRAASYSEALEELRRLGYRKIQLEFGLMGFAELLKQIDLFLISGLESMGVNAFLQTNGLSASQTFSLSDLTIAVGSGRGKV